MWHAGGCGPRGPSRHSSIRACFLQGLWSEGKGGAAQELLQTSSCCMPGAGGRCPSFACRVCACVRVCAWVYILMCVCPQVQLMNLASELGSSGSLGSPLRVWEQPAQSPEQTSLRGRRPPGLTQSVPRQPFPLGSRPPPVVSFLVQEVSWREKESHRGMSCGLSVDSVGGAVWPGSDGVVCRVICAEG